ncbi:MAG: hypothetical protein GYB19_17190 [Rhodospirillales bacterium]|nr:hypothetical protein [Rhodospirillales bacterium]
MNAGPSRTFFVNFLSIAVLNIPILLAIVAVELILVEFSHLLGYQYRFAWVYSYIATTLLWLLPSVAVLKGRFIPTAIFRCSGVALLIALLMAVGIEIANRFLVTAYRIFVPEIPNILEFLGEIDRSYTLVYFARTVLDNAGHVLTIPVYLFLGTWVVAFIIQGNCRPKHMVKRGVAAFSYFVPRYVLCVGGVFLLAAGAMWSVIFLPFPHVMYSDPQYSFSVAGVNYSVITTGATTVSVFISGLKSFMLGVLIAHSFQVGEAHLSYLDEQSEEFAPVEAV